MKPYFSPNRVPILGMIFLVSGSLVLGLAIGTLAYFVSSLIYYLIVFSLVVGGVTMLAYYKLLEFAKVRHSIVSASMGLISGLLVALAYYGTPYLIFRNEFIKGTQNSYHVSAEKASNVFDKILTEETGSSGLLGYMKLRAREGDQYTHYLVENGMPIHEFNFTLKSTWAWLYWCLETVFFAVPTAWIGYEVGTRAFSASANDWYDSLPKQISAAPIQCKNSLLALLNESKLQEISELAVAEEGLTHPMLEIYEQRSNNKKGDILLSVKETFRDKNQKIKRNTIGQWEISEPKYASLTNMIIHHLKTG